LVVDLTALICPIPSSCHFLAFPAESFVWGFNDYPSISFPDHPLLALLSRDSFLKVRLENPFLLVVDGFTRQAPFLVRSFVAISPPTSRFRGTQTRSTSPFLLILPAPVPHPRFRGPSKFPSLLPFRSRRCQPFLYPSPYSTSDGAALLCLPPTRLLFRISGLMRSSLTPDPSKIFSCQIEIPPPGLCYVFSLLL